MRFLPEVPPVFVSLIVNFSFLLANWLEMHKMRCIRQVNKNNFPFLHNFIEIMILAFWGLAGRKSSAIFREMNVDTKQLWIFIYFLWNALGSWNLVWWYIIILLVHLDTKWCLMTLIVIFKVIGIGYNLYRGDLG